MVGELGVRFYAGAPLKAPGGERIGALCLIDSSPRRLTPEERALFEILAELVERELASSADLEQGREIQRRLLPRQTPALDGWELGGSCRPMSAVGGDFYDWQEIGDRVQVMVCDVMGKGLSAALIAAAVRVLARGAAPYVALAANLERIDRDLGEDLEETGRFVTAFFARLDPTDGALQYADAGHGLAFVLEAAGGYRRLISQDLPLGAIAGDRWQVHDARIEPGECLLVVSDGFLDLHPDVDAVVAALAPVATGELPAAEAAEALTRPAGWPSDDLTVLLVRRSPA